MSPPAAIPQLAMRRIDQSLLRVYSRRDRIGRLLADESQPADAGLTVQKWLVATPAKRLIYEMLYGDLLESRGLRILDVGGALNALTRRLACRHRYELVDLMVHDAPAQVAAYRAAAELFSLRIGDWWSCDFSDRYDVVVANDLFPNVDQRLSLFLERMMPIASQIRLSLTYYNRPRFYLTKRVDADEILCMLAWNGVQVADALAPYRDRIAEPDFALFERSDESVFDNGRQVIVMALRGDAARD